LTFADKYLKNGKSQKCSKGKLGGMDEIKKKFPADISIELAEKIKSYAGQIFKSLNLCGVVRIDFLYDEENDKLFVCEANAIPGSLAYYFFNRGRVVIDEFVLKLIDIAEDVHQKSKRFNKEFMTTILG
jgi:D-alanine-D-alanine ligase